MERNVRHALGESVRSVCTSGSQHLRVTALNPDNAVEIAQLIDLFKCCYGESYPLRKVYDPQFWRAHAGFRFTSIVALYADQPVMHLALHPERNGTDRVQLCLMANHPDLLTTGVDRERLRQELRTKISEILNSLGARQNWQLLYQFIFDGISYPATHTDRITHRENTTETFATTFCPQYLTSSSASLSSGVQQRCKDVILAQRVISTARAQQRRLYVPRAHANIVEQLYRPLGWPRSFSSSSHGRKLRDRATIPADFPAVDQRTYSRTGVSHMFLQPSLIRSEKSVIKALKNAETPSCFAFINATDPSCPSLAEKLEENSFRFCGVVPLLEGRDSLAYWRSDPQWLDSALTQSHPLASYIKSYSLPQITAAKKTKPKAGYTKAGDGLIYEDVSKLVLADVNV